MAWLRSNWRWTALNLLGVAVLTFVLSLENSEGNTIDVLDPGLESGKWAIRFLLVCLAITPLNTYFGWRSLIGLRKPAGLWAFGFAGLHVALLIYETRLSWLTWPIRPFIGLGLLGLLILTALALTSNRRAMRRLKKHWKRLHRLVYLAGGASAVHAILAAAASKKMLVLDPQAVHELRVYLAVLVVLLVVRLPPAKRVLARRRPQRQVERPVFPLPIPGSTPEPWPLVYEREVGIPSDDLNAGVWPEKDYAPLVASIPFDPSRRN